MSQAELETAQKEKLRIAFFTHSYSPFLTGVATGAHHRVRSLLERGHEVFLIHPEVNDLFPEEVRQRKMPGLEELQGFENFSETTYPTKPHPFDKTHSEPRSHRHWSDTELLKEFQPDAVAVDDAAGMRGLSSLYWGGYGRSVGEEYYRLTGTPTVELFETDYLSYAEHHLGKCFVKLLQPLLSVMVGRFTRGYTASFYPSRTHKEKYGVYDVHRPMYVPFHGVDCEQYHPDNARFSPIPDDQRPTLLFVGRITKEKSVTDLFDALEIIRKEIPDVHLVIVGNGVEMKKVHRKAEALGSHATVWGESYGKELKGWYTRADLFLNPSVTENFCTTNMEALASGTPVIAAGAGGNREQVIDGVNGFLTEPNKPADIASKVVTALQDSSLRAEMSRQAREKILAFDHSACAEQLEKALRGLIEEQEAERTADEGEGDRSSVSAVPK